MLFAAAEKIQSYLFRGNMVYERQDMGHVGPLFIS